MVKKKVFSIVFTEEQDENLRKRAESQGFMFLSDYIRFILFMELSFLEKVDQIHKKVCDNAGENEKTDALQEH